MSASRRTAASVSFFFSDLFSTVRRNTIKARSSGNCNNTGVYKLRQHHDVNWPVSSRPHHFSADCIRQRPCNPVRGKDNPGQQAHSASLSVPSVSPFVTLLPVQGIRVLPALVKPCGVTMLSLDCLACPVNIIPVNVFRHTHRQTNGLPWS